MAQLSSLKQLFKKPMDQDVHLNLDQPEAPAQEAAPVEPEAQGEEVANEAPAESVEKKTEDEAPASSEDRSAYNCVPCGGEGLKDQSTICPNCHGTGKV